MPNVFFFRLIRFSFISVVWILYLKLLHFVCFSLNYAVKWIFLMSLIKCDVCQENSHVSNEYFSIQHTYVNDHDYTIQRDSTLWAVKRKTEHTSWTHTILYIIPTEFDVSFMVRRKTKNRTKSKWIILFTIRLPGVWQSILLNH